MHSGQQTDYDILIAGGGMVGACLALALSPLRLKVAVVEAVPRGAVQQPSFDDRSTALSRSSQRMFEAMGLWPAIAAASTPIARIHVSDKGRFGFSHIDAKEQGIEALGHVVINRVLGEVLQDALGHSDGLHIVCPGRIVSVAQDDQRAEVAVETGGCALRLRCRLLVAADGANSEVRDMLGISATRRDYRQSAVIGNLLPDKPPANVAYERFTEDGALAMLPVAGERAAFVWVRPPERADELLALRDEDFLARLQSAFGYRLGGFSKIGKRAAYPLSLSKANSLVARRSVVIGNAAHGLHPVAAQGFNLGMRDIAALCDCIADALAAGKDPGAAATLDAYAAWREPDQKKLVRFTDGLVRLFGSHRTSVRALRDAGMLGFDLVPGVRQVFAKHTMGLSGHLPRLSRGVPLE